MVDLRSRGIRRRGGYRSHGGLHGAHSGLRGLGHGRGRVSHAGPLIVSGGKGHGFHTGRVGYGGYSHGHSKGGRQHYGGRQGYAQSSGGYGKKHHGGVRTAVSGSRGAHGSRGHYSRHRATYKPRSYKQAVSSHKANAKETTVVSDGYHTHAHGRSAGHRDVRHAGYGKPLGGHYANRRSYW